MTDTLELINFLKIYHFFYHMKLLQNFFHYKLQS